jgi:predicted RNA methylase
MFRPYRLTQEADFAAFSDAGVHARMLRDSVRVASFKRAVDAIVRPGMRVLDIGAGTGILSFWAARAGAEVIAVEASSIAEVIPALAARNGLVDRIHVDPRRSFDINLRDRCELLITETLGHMGIDEGIVFASADAKARLLTSTAPIIPRSVRITCYASCVNLLLAIGGRFLEAPTSRI